MTVEFTHSPLLGTVVEVQLEASAETAREADQAILATFRRLEDVFSIYRGGSELNRWQRGEVDTCSTDLLAVLTAAQHWFEASEGAFHPATGVLRAQWLAAQVTGSVPSRAELAGIAKSNLALPYRVSGSAVECLGDCAALDLNGIAKGYIVDRAVEAAFSVPGVSSVMVNAGGDLRHRGEGSIRVGIEDPSRPFDNEPPRAQIAVTDAGLATSGNARRGFRVGNRWFGHVLDPRTGWPVEHNTSVTVLAPDAMSADLLATILGVLERGEAIAFAASRNVDCLLIGAGGEMLASPNWPH